MLGFVNFNDHLEIWSVPSEEIKVKVKVSNLMQDFNTAYLMFSSTRSMFECVCVCVCVCNCIEKMKPCISHGRESHTKLTTIDNYNKILIQHMYVLNYCC